MYARGVHIAKKVLALITQILSSCWNRGLDFSKGLFTIVGGDTSPRTQNAHREMPIRVIGNRFWGGGLINLYKSLSATGVNRQGGLTCTGDISRPSCRIRLRRRLADVISMIYARPYGYRKIIVRRSHSAPRFYASPFRAHCAPPFHRERLVLCEQCLPRGRGPWAAGGHKGDLPAISEGSHCAIADRDRNPARASAPRDNGKRLGNRMCNMHSREETRTSCMPGIFRSRGFAAYPGFVRDERKTGIHFSVTTFSTAFVLARTRARYHKLANLVFLTATAWEAIYNF